MNINDIKEFIITDCDKFVKYNNNFVLNEESVRNSEHEDFTYSRRIVLSPNLLYNKLNYINITSANKIKNQDTKLVDNIKSRIKQYDKEISSLLAEKKYNPLRDQKINTYANIIKELSNIIENV